MQKQALKGLSYEIDWRKFTDLGLDKGRGWFLNFSEASLIFSWNKTSFPVNAKITPITYVIRLILLLDSWQAFLTNAVCFMSNISTYHLAHRRPNTRFCGACRTYANFFLLDTNITPFQNNKTQAASSFTFSPVQCTLILRVGGLTKISS